MVDSGFYSEAAVSAVEHRPEGSARGVTVYAAVEKHSHHETVADLLPQPEPTAPGPEASAKEIMAHRLQTLAGKALYKLRFAQMALGHNSKGVHRAYAKKAQVTLPPLEEYEQKIVPFNGVKPAAAVQGQREHATAHAVSA